MKGQKSRFDSDDPTTHKLRRAVETAAAEYQAAKAQHESLMSEGHELGKTHPDGALAIRQAIRLKTSALSKYAIALKNVNEWIIYEKEPSAEGEPTPKIILVVDDEPAVANF